MGKSSRVDQIPMLEDDDSQSLELSRMGSNADFSRTGSNADFCRMGSNADFSLKISDEDHIDQFYGATGACVSVKTLVVPNDTGKHEHLLKSGPMGRCYDTFCSTCPSYFGPAEDRAQVQADQVKKVVVGRANFIRHRAASWSRRWIPGVLNPHTKVVKRWNKIFCISSLIAIFVDPLFFFLLSISEDSKCLMFNNNAAVAVTVVRTLTDTIHFIHILLQFRLAYVAPASRVRGAGELEDNPKRIAIHYLQGWFVLDVFTALPLPQLLIWTVVKKMLGKENGANYAKNVLRVVVLVQNIPRSIRFVPLLFGRSPIGFVFETAWSNFVINLLMYLLAGHIVGSSWYLLALQRANLCLQQTCDNESIGFSGSYGNFSCLKRYLDCGSSPINADDNTSYLLWKNSTSIPENCLLLYPNTNPFQYGIYLEGLPVVLESSIINKYIYSLFWGFLQISTLAGNQIPSIFPWEVLFTMSIVGLGLLLFALLIGNMQNFLQALGRRKLDMQLKRYDTEAWMKKRRLPMSLRRRVRQAGRFRWAATGGVEEHELVNDLPEDLQRDIQRYLCLELVKKVRLFEMLEDHVLEAICECLRQKLYIDDSEIFRVKKPIDRMLFIVHGQLESRGEDGSVLPLSEGDVCGDELLSFYIDKTGVSKAGAKAGSKKNRGKHPLSSRTVKCLTSVEAFSLDSAGLEYITTHYKVAFKSPRVQGVIRYLSLYWRSLAASRIQKAWRSSKERSTEPGNSSAAVPRNRRIARFGTMNNRAYNDDE